ncbi:hypothetical protein [Dolichospermum sp. LEGE 00246]|uniref:hypothetical protein n=1 Tax=Aphanizomenonaceae TaxID=1892259 RepID=UPI000541A28F|nr:hypothetical protein OA07_01175 [Aphanizomenon flos-aquae 2012/KM1/D3]
MNIQRWIGRREANWQRLDALLKKVEQKRLKSLRSAEIRGRSSLIISTHNYPYITVCPSLQEVDQQNPSTVAANQGRF